MKIPITVRQRYATVSQLPEGTISIRVDMSDGYHQTLMMTPGDFKDMLGAVNTLAEIIGIDDGQL